MAFSESEYELKRVALEDCDRRWSENLRSRTLTGDESMQLALKLNECRTAFQATFGWHTVDCDKLIFQLWDRLYALFGSDGIFTLKPNECWDISHLLGAPDLADLKLDLNQKCFAAIKSCYEPQSHWYAFENVSHSYYTVDFDEMSHQIQDWPIPLFPDWDPCVIVSPDFQTGIVATLGSSIMVFGDDLVSVINQDPPHMFTERKST